MSKTNKFITDKISQHFLTPIRRVGLPRIRKNNNVSGITSQSSPSLPQKEANTNKAVLEINKEFKVSVDKKPKYVNSAKELTENTLKNNKHSKTRNERLGSTEDVKIKEKCDETSFITSTSKNVNPENKGNESKTKRTKDLVIRNSLKSSPKMKKQIRLEEECITIKGKYDDNDFVKSELNEQKIAKCKKTTKARKRRFISSEDENEENRTENIKPQLKEEKTDKEATEIAENENNVNSKQSKIRKRRLISSDKSEEPKERKIVNCNEKLSKSEPRKAIEDEDDDFCIKNPISRNNSNDPKTEHTKKANKHKSDSLKENSQETVKMSQTKQKESTFKRCLSLKKSSFSSTERDSPLDFSQKSNSSTKSCSVLLERVSPLQVSQKALNVFAEVIDEEKVANLERQVKEKRELLEAMKRAEIYRNLHNTKDLEELRKWWKNGCISALNDLLPQVQEYSKMGMGELLDNLKIPQNLIALSSDGDLQ